MKVPAGAMINGFDPGSAERLDEGLRTLVERRQRAMGPAYRLFYSKPVQFVRGDGVNLYDAEGREYLDAYNNVPSIGHSHPAVADAVSSQLRTLNTHTRYLDESVVAYAERLLATHGDHLHRVMLTCTGSEAVDLAYRIARFHTGAEGVIVTENAYHGNSTAVSAFSPSLGAASSLGPHVRTVPAPGPGFADDEHMSAAFANAVADAVADLERHGYRLAAFIADTVFSSDGLFPGPAGFLAEAREVVRAAGGLYLADEVQPGFGRMGQGLWGYQHHNIDPDIVVMGKPMGNGVPIAGLVARSEVIDQFGSDVRYFNTFGGGAASVAAARTVLDVIESDGLVENSRRMGARLLGAIEALAPDAPWVSRVRGLGLYLSVDVVDPVSGAPSPELAQAVVNGLRERGVLISSTGPTGASLKIRPLLPFRVDHVDRFVEVLSDVNHALNNHLS